MWLILVFLSAIFMGVNDALKKVSFINNALISVVFLNTIFCSLFLLPFLLFSYFCPNIINQSHFFVPHITPETHLLILLKSGLALCGWLLIDFAIKHLPLTIVAPVKASQPVFVILGAMLLFSEKLNTIQWFGVAFFILSFLFISTLDKNKESRTKNSKWTLFLILGVLVNAICALFDKYLMVNYNQMAIFVWYNLYLTLLMSIIFTVKYLIRSTQRERFFWRWQILVVSLFICLSDFTYFYSLSCEGAMISIASMIRRSGIIISFLLGAWFFHEKNLKRRAIGLILMLISVILLFYGSMHT
ncbi:EamA family transporter [Bacteroides ovatus]|uniref:EamA family transporter n=1 Tax=Bacteroides ovatus TaxID=28116 RepID=UPI00321BF6CA